MTTIKGVQNKQIIRNDGNVKKGDLFSGLIIVKNGHRHYMWNPIQANFSQGDSVYLTDSRGNKLTINISQSNKTTAQLKQLINPFHV